MKKKNLNQKLQLNKETIAKLNQDELNSLVGGTKGFTQTICGGTACTLSCINTCNTCYNTCGIQNTCNQSDCYGTCASACMTACNSNPCC